MKGLEAFLELTKLDLGKPLRNAGNEEIYKKMSLVKKELKALEIIVAKCVDMYRLAVADNVVSYNKWIEFDEYWLTEEEFNLIKEMLK